MTGPSDEPGDGEDDAVDLDEPRPPSTATEPVQDPIDWEAQSEGGAELEGELNEVRPPSTATEPVQEPPDSVRAGRGEDASDDDERESGSEGDGS
ncbi:hypothetical protein [Halorubrum salsamenti]|uniref:hypothetical protein n=1 Tax=Halorubrum salsamenti TaxID=2583990 RepID=UPI0011A91D39|nr:hypothetical protein [Halorubrum salsamenti]